MEAREAKGLAIAASVEPHRKSNVYTVPSQGGCKTYAVDLSADPPTCTCPDYAERRRECKHIFAARFAVQREGGETLPEAAPQTAKRPTYKQAWREYNLSQTREKGFFQDLLYQLCQGIDEPVRKGGRGRPAMPMRDLIFAAGVKVYEGLSGRRNQTDLREARERGFLSRQVHYNTIFKYLEMETLTPYLHHLITESSLPLKTVEVDFAVDSSGFSTCNYVRWYDVKYGNTEDWRDWIKLHLITGVKTNIVTSCEVSRRYANDSPYFKPLVTKTAANGFKLREVSADKEYLSASNIRLTLLKGGDPYIPFKVNSVPGQNTTIWNRMLHFYRYHEAEFNAHYHKRSNVETTFWMIKAKFGERLRSKTETAQTNEALLKVLCHNICCVIQSVHEFGLEVEFMGRS
jgi:transposase